MASPMTRKDRSHDDESRHSAQTQMPTSGHAASGNPTPKSSSPTSKSSNLAANARYRDAVRMWLQWNEAYETATGRIFEKRSDPQAMQDEMDRMDQLRRQAITFSQELLEHSRSDCPASD